MSQNYIVIDKVKFKVPYLPKISNEVILCKKPFSPDIYPTPGKLIFNDFKILITNEKQKKIIDKWQNEITDIVVTKDVLKDFEIKNKDVHVKILGCHVSYISDDCKYAIITPSYVSYLNQKALKEMQ